MARTVTAEFETAADSSLTNIFGDDLNADDAVTRSVRLRLYDSRGGTTSATCVALKKI